MLSDGARRAQNLIPRGLSWAQYRGPVYCKAVLDQHPALPLVNVVGVHPRPILGLRCPFWLHHLWRGTRSADMRLHLVTCLSEKNHQAAPPNVPMVHSST